MSSFLCFLCHSTVNMDTSDDIRDKYQNIVGVHLCPDSQLCTICCQVVNKLCQFRTMCLKRSLEYPVLFSEKLFMNLQKSDTELITVCNDENCKQKPYEYNNKVANYTFIHNETNNVLNNDEIQDNNSNSYVKLEVDERKDNNQLKQKPIENNINYEDYNNFNYNENHEYDPRFNYTNNLYDNSNDNSVNNDYFEQINNHNEVDDNVHELAENYDNSHEVNENETCDVTEAETNHNYYNSEFNENFNQELIENEIETTKNEVDLQKHITTENNTDLQQEEKIEEVAKKESKSEKKKHKKRSYEKIELSLKEQKTELDNQRKLSKYIDAEFKCFRCALGFRFKDTYQSHMMRHEESNGQFSCPTCGLRFATQNAKCMHTILHSELYKCNKCGVLVKRTHRVRHSRVCWESGVDVSCHLCGKTFRDSNCLQQHLKRFHAAKTSRRTYSCNVCGKNYKEQSAVRNHMVKHLNHRFSCPKCASTFGSPYTLNQHLKSHSHLSEEQQYECSACDTKYRTKKSLMAHLRNTLKHQQISLECPHCSRVCGNARALTRHMRRHDSTRHDKTATARETRRAKGGELCHCCGRTYSTKSKLNRHVKEVCGRQRIEDEITALYEQTTNDI